MADFPGGGWDKTTEGWIKIPLTADQVADCKDYFGKYRWETGATTQAYVLKALVTIDHLVAELVAERELSAEMRQRWYDADEEADDNFTIIQELRARIAELEGK